MKYSKLRKLTEEISRELIKNNKQDRVYVNIDEVKRVDKIFHYDEDIKLF